MRSDNSSGVNPFAYVGACAALVLVIGGLSKLAPPNGPGEPSAAMQERQRLQESFSEGLQQANEEWEQSVREDEAKIAAERAQKDAKEREAWNRLRLGNAGEITEPFLP